MRRTLPVWVIMIIVSSILAAINNWWVTLVWSLICFIFGTFFFIWVPRVPGSVADWMLQPNVIILQSWRISILLAGVGVICLVIDAWLPTTVMGVRLLIFAVVHLLGYALWKWQTPV